ncbi:MAG TPA: pyridoxamine 5'-phosphate oxidase family protein [Acetobacteraceae bacterium]|nr:pyridoxamine 5'-phosphate oxidase family protein [Acetobacteraceae bacterium]
MTPPLPLLEHILADALTLLAAAPTERDHPCRTPVLATTGPDGAPGARTVVLRGFDPGARQAMVFTDARSAKVAALRREPRATLVFHDPGRAVQLRLSGRMAVRQGDAVAEEAWRGLPAASQGLYAAAAAPGTPVAAPPPPPGGSTDGPAHFAVLVLEFTRLDWLSLDAAGHRRACFAWETEGPPRATWVVP